MLRRQVIYLFYPFLVVRANKNVSENIVPKRMHRCVTILDRGDVVISLLFGSLGQLDLFPWHFLVGNQAEKMRNEGSAARDAYRRSAQYATVPGPYPWLPSIRKLYTKQVIDL